MKKKELFKERNKLIRKSICYYEPSPFYKSIVAGNTLFKNSRTSLVGSGLLTRSKAAQRLVATLQNCLSQSFPDLLLRGDIAESGKNKLIMNSYPCQFEIARSLMSAPGKACRNTFFQNYVPRGNAFKIKRTYIMQISFVIGLDQFFLSFV